jgi:hypothetical protein
MQTIGEVQYSDAQRALISVFLEHSGYGERDLLSLNFSTGVFMTRNGGRYQIKGKDSDTTVKWLAGPPVDPEYRL